MNKKKLAYGRSPAVLTLPFLTEFTKNVERLLLYRVPSAWREWQNLLADM
jgi:hypothetical protein